MIARLSASLPMFASTTHEDLSVLLAVFLSQHRLLVLLVPSSSTLASLLWSLVRSPTTASLLWSLVPTRTSLVVRRSKSPNRLSLFNTQPCRSWTHSTTIYLPSPSYHPPVSLPALPYHKPSRDATIPSSFCTQSPPTWRRSLWTATRHRARLPGTTSRACLLIVVAVRPYALLVVPSARWFLCPFEAVCVRLSVVGAV